MNKHLIENSLSAVDSLGGLGKFLQSVIRRPLPLWLPDQSRQPH